MQDIRLVTSIVQKSKSQRQDESPIKNLIGDCRTVGTESLKGIYKKYKEKLQHGKKNYIC